MENPGLRPHCPRSLPEIELPPVEFECTTICNPLGMAQVVMLLFFAFVGSARSQLQSAGA